MPDEKWNRKTFEEELNQLGTQIADLLRRLETAAEKEAETLRPKLKAAQERLHELKHTSAEAWGDLKPGLERAWDEFHKSFNQAAARFKSRQPRG